MVQKVVNKSLNVDVASAITEFKAMVKEFKLKRDIYKIIFRGKGLEFEAYRDFSPDDDASYIDWKASSRAQKLLVKQYKEERDLKIMFLIDVGSNMVFGSTEKLKCEYAAEVTGALANLIMEANDRVGLFLFSDHLKHFVKPKQGKKHFQFLMDLISSSKNYGGFTNFDKSIEEIMKYLDHSIHSVIIISDFLNVTRATEKKLNLISQMFETILIRVRDPLDFTMPEVDGEVTLENPMTHSQVVVNPKVARKLYEKYAFEQSQFLQHIISKTQADFLDLVTSKPFPVPLALFLKGRVEKAV